MAAQSGLHTKEEGPCERYKRFLHVVANVNTGGDGRTTSLDDGRTAAGRRGIAEEGGGRVKGVAAVVAGPLASRSL